MMRLCNHPGQLWSYQQESWRKVSQNLKELLATDIFTVVHYHLYIHQPVTLHCGARVEPRPRELHPFPGDPGNVALPARRAASCMHKMKNIIFVFLAYFILGTGHLHSATG